jgi:DNA-binding NarL/FixJ family response regulator
LGGVISGIRIVVVGNHPQLMDALVDLVIEEPGLFLVGAAGNSAEAITMAQVHTPDVVLIDMEATDIGAARIAHEISKQTPSTRLVALSSYHDVTSVRRATDAGFHHIVSKSSDVDDLLKILLEDHACLAQ